MDYIIIIAPLFLGWILDRMLGDPAWLPHPVVGFGKAISFCERIFNKGKNRTLKGGVCAVMLIASVFLISSFILKWLSFCSILKIAVESLLVFYCLAGKTLIREVMQVFLALERSLDDGRRQVARIVGRDTSDLSPKEIRTAALETLAENLSDGVVAPLFWFAILGVPGMLAYKMINTLDSMIGYRNERYSEFGMIAAKIDDVANYFPARLTAILMIAASGKLFLWRFVAKFGRMHASPNSGYPESALAGILDCRFGGPHDYFGETVYKPFIGDRERDFNFSDAETAAAINRHVEMYMLIIAAVVRCLIPL